MYGDLVGFIVTLIGNSAKASGSAIQAAQTVSPHIAMALQTVAQNPDGFGQVIGWFVDAVVDQFDEYGAARNQQNAALLNHYSPQRADSMAALSVLNLNRPSEHKPD